MRRSLLQRLTDTVLTVALGAVGCAVVLVLWYSQGTDSTRQR